MTQYKYGYINTVGSMSVRPTPNTNNTPIGSLPVNTKAFGDEVTVLSNGDKWLKILETQTGQALVGYVAVIHQSKNYGVLTEIKPTPVPPTTPNFPEWFILTDPQGNKARYEFVRIITE